MAGNAALVIDDHIVPAFRIDVHSVNAAHKANARIIDALIGLDGKLKLLRHETGQQASLHAQVLDERLPQASSLSVLGGSKGQVAHALCLRLAGKLLIERKGQMPLRLFQVARRNALFADALLQRTVERFPYRVHENALLQRP